MAVPWNQRGGRPPSVPSSTLVTRETRIGRIGEPAGLSEAVHAIGYVHGMPRAGWYRAEIVGAVLSSTTDTVASLPYGPCRSLMAYFRLYPVAAQNSSRIQPFCPRLDRW
jgi:hypothetical protein